MGVFRKELLTIPNIMSLFRVASAPLLALFWLGLEWRVSVLVLGVVSGVTDLLDGWVARKLNQTTELGALIDQLGDLVFESICILIAVVIGELSSAWLVVYLFREFTVNVVRSYVVGRGGNLPSTDLGKIKTSFIQFAFFPLFLGDILIQPGVVPEAWNLVNVSPGRFLIEMASVFISLGLVMGLASGWVYLRAFAAFYSAQKRTSE